MAGFIGSDHHFDHKNIIKYQEHSRPFYSFDAAGEIERDDEGKLIVHRAQVHAMNEAMIERHNSMVSDNDDFYILGDFAFADGEKIVKWLDRMNGRKYFIFGNHDHGMHGEEVRKRFVWMKHYYELRVPGIKAKAPLFHFPIESWHRIHYGAIHFHGHLHASGVNKGRRFDVGVDGNNLYPYNLEELVEDLLKIDPVLGDDHHQNKE